MARTVITTMTCDLDGAPNAATYQLTPNSEVDLCDSCRQDYLTLIGKYIEVSRPIRRPGKAHAMPKTPRPQRKGADPSAVREWARQQGLPVGDRGRLTKDVFAQYEAANA